MKRISVNELKELKFKDLENCYVKIILSDDVIYDFSEILIGMDEEGRCISCEDGYCYECNGRLEDNLFEYEKEGFGLDSDKELENIIDEIYIIDKNISKCKYYDEDEL